MKNSPNKPKVVTGGGKRRPKTPVGQHIIKHWPKHPKAMDKLK